MILFHGSNKLGLTELKPQQADHDRPYVYMSTIDTVAAFYLCNAVERPYYWFPYDFDKSGIPIYHELYPNALREVSEGVRGCIYIVDAQENQFIPFKNIPCARLGIEPIQVKDTIQIENAYEFFWGYIRQGKLIVSRYEDKSPEALKCWHRIIANYMMEKKMLDTPDCIYAKFVKEKIPEAWKLLNAEGI